MKSIPGPLIVYIVVPTIGFLILAYMIGWNIGFGAGVDWARVQVYGR